MHSMMLAVWICLAFLVVATVGSLVVAATHGWRLWRAFRGLSGRITDALGEVERSAAAAESHAAGLGEGSEHLNAAIARLQVSLAELAAIGGAAAEARSLLAGVRGVVPRK
jgi:hypothetical protein